MRTSPPAALTANRSRRLPGTRSMSPNEQKITSGRAATATARSISSSGVTQTGHPGPWTSVTSDGSSSSIPWRTIEWVCPPQTSMSTHGRVTAARIAASSRPTAAGSRYSSRNRIGSLPDLVQLAGLGQQGEHPVGLGLIEPGQGEPDVNQGVLPDGDVRDVLQAHPLEDPAEVDAAHEQVVLAVHFDDLAGDAQAHARDS